VSGSTASEDLRRRLIELESFAAESPAAIEIVRSPGRVNLIGEYTDVNEGFVLPAAIDREIRIALVPSRDRRVVMHRLDTGETGSFELESLPSRAGGWLDYAVGTAWALAAAGVNLRGIRGAISTNLPPGAGLSSSAAIELAITRALIEPGAQSIEGLELARICQRAENLFVGVQSGLMDQFAVACGRAGSALLLDCRSLEWRSVPLPEEFRLVVCDTGSPRELAGSEYNVRRRQCEAAVAALARDDPGIHSLRDVTPEVLAGAESSGRLDPLLARRARHVVSENGRVLAAVAALEADDIPAVADAFAESHASLRDQFEVSSPALDAMVEIATSTPGVEAARMTGAGFGGCTINLVRSDAVDRLAARVERDYPGRTGLSPRVFPVTAADGAGFVA